MLGTTLNHYRILRQLGAGGMGEVFEAEDTKLHRKVALKVLPASVAADPERRERFEREARAGTPSGGCRSRAASRRSRASCNR